MRLAFLYWLLALACLTGIGVVLCPEGVCVVPGMDQAGLEFAHTLSGPLPDRFMAAATWLGSIWVLLPLVVLAGLGFWFARRRRQAVFLLLALLGATALAHIFKHGIDRPRPDLFPALAALPMDAAYPSAHTMQAVAVALAATTLAVRQWPWLPPVLLLLAALVAWSRIHLQVHFPSDVLAGALAAALWVAGLKRLLLAEPGKVG